MISRLISVTGLIWLSTAAVLLAGSPAAAPVKDLKFEAHLLWGTDETKPPEGKAYKPASTQIRDELKKLPLKWSNWFEVNDKSFAAAQGAAKEISLSDKCQLNVKPLSSSEVEVWLIGKGKEVMKRKQSLPKGEVLVLGGNAPNSTAWLVVLKRVE